MKSYLVKYHLFDLDYNKTVGESSKIVSANSAEEAFYKAGGGKLDGAGLSEIVVDEIIDLSSQIK